ncbi:MAG TPA: DUF3826 domain-containing protein [Tepidisphaeraceae bacterium]|nr:DUF3826 domain-containing protein [Tepidisphaeraceae bacterium]
MRISAWSLIVLSCLCGAAFAAPTDDVAAPAVTASDQEAAYEADLNQRAGKIITALKLDDAAKADRVREILVAQYRALRGLHEARDAKLKDVPKDQKEQAAQVKAETDAAVKPLHDAFLAKLSAELTPEQVETVKDGMTYNVVQVTYDGFCDMLPNLTDAEKAYILAQLKEAREIAMDQGSSKDKHAVFGKYKGRINNYLSKQGYDLKQASKDWADRRKAREAQAKQAAATQPAN